VRIDLGMKARDVLTGMTGLVNAHARYLTGCDQYLIQPEAKADEVGRVRPAGEWFDENRLEVLEDGAIQPAARKVRAAVATAPAETGADIEAPVK